PAFAKAEYDLTAGAGTDNAAQTCAVLDLGSDFDDIRFGSGTAIVATTATLDEGETLIVTGKWQQSVDNAAWADVKDGETVLTLLGATGGTTETGAGKLGVNLAEASRYVRFVYTPDLSAADTDTAKVSVQYVFTGASEI
ncbi:hypothetical protein, partial [Thalassospira sp. MCCC 1A01428]|uniref:hypothetical protein n=1 Tax=Thalassospira sp. MCCC 1A01428 TaxID=1470575 RepID=UPI000A1F8D2A